MYIYIYIYIYIYNKTNIKRNILTIKKIYREVGRAKDLSASRYMTVSCENVQFTEPYTNNLKVGGNNVYYCVKNLEESVHRVFSNVSLWFAGRHLLLC